MTAQDEIRKLQESAALLQGQDEEGGAVNKDCRDFARFIQAKHPAVFAALMSKFKDACPSVWDEYLENRRKRGRKQRR